MIKNELLSYAKVGFNAVSLGKGYLPPFRAVSIRGGFGHHLKRTVCSTGKTDCTGCMLRSDCVYSYVFDGFTDNNQEFMKLYDNVPQPFVIETDFGSPTDISEDTQMSFELLLLGKTVQYFPYIAYSIIEMGKSGLGRDRIVFDVSNIKDILSDQVLYSNESNCITKPSTRELFLPELTEQTHDITIDLVSPVRIRKDGKDSKDFSFIDIVLTTIRRLEILTYFYGNRDMFDNIKSISHDCPDIEAFESDLRLVSIDRFSGRQQMKMKLNGIVGSVSYKNVPERFVKILKLAEILHTGKSTSFGFGKIAVNL